MSRFHRYYYLEPNFQLELNLQYIRRELIELLEEHDFNEFFDCNCFECWYSSDLSSQSITLPSTRTSSYSDLSSQSVTLSSASSDSDLSSQSTTQSSTSSYCDLSSQSTTLSNTCSGSDFPEKRDYSMDIFYNVAPPAETLPRPIWPENRTSNEHARRTPKKIAEGSVASLNIWIRASLPNVTQSDSRVIFPVPSKVLDEVNFLWPPFPPSIWSEETLNQTIARENILWTQETYGNTSVAEFFQYFSGIKQIPKTAIP